MKIANITNITNIHQYENLKRNRNKDIKQTTVSIPINNIYLGRDIVSFGNRPFHETLKENYFQLPKGCFPDEFQIEAGKGLNEGKSVLVEAPTGTGKTAIAHYAATKNIKDGKTTFYTTPLKALSNQKLNEFRAVYGDENVGILTGDRRENAQAPIVIMTTEVYRNMAIDNAYGNKNPLMDNLGTVIFDEFHYLGDTARGNVWEDSLIYTPKNVQTLALSATIGNPEDIKDWIGSLNDNNVKLVSMPSEARHVPLKFDCLQTKSYKKTEDWIQRKLARTGTFDYDSMEEYSPKPDLSDYKNAVNKLSNEEQLPAIFFVFSRKFSRELLGYLGKESKSLTNDTEKEQIKEILNKRKNEKYIGEDLNENALLNGYAIHNAGIIPAQKELIEELFQKKLIKTVIATETLAAGINMPAKTVVISSPYKPSDSDEDDEYKMRTLTANEFKQMAGRAGRRGIDTQGYVYTMPTDRTSEMDFLELETTECNHLESQYNPDYSFLCGFYKYNAESEKLKNIFEKSFYAFNNNEEISKNNINKLIDNSMKKTQLLKERNFLTEINGGYELTDKGLMASKVKGYNAIPLVEMISSGKMKDITPETLALIAGAVATDVNTEENEIDNSTDFSLLTGNPEKHTENIKERLEKSVCEKMKMLGKSINSFNNYTEMLNYARNLSKPDADADILQSELSDLNEKYNKISIIQQKNVQMSPEELIKALKAKQTIPTVILKDNIAIVEEFKKRMPAKDIDTYIQKLEYEEQELSASIKGKKAQNKQERKIKTIQNDINNAKNMKFLEDNLYGAINENQKFIKKNQPEKVKRDLHEAQVQFVRLISKDTLVSELEGLKSIENYLQNNDLKERNDINCSQVADCIKKMINESSLLKDEEIRLDLPSNTDKFGKFGAQTAYNWVLMNSINSSSMSNWQELIHTVTSVDEGILYGSILQTADLLSQISEIADAGMQSAMTNEDTKYYRHLKKTAAKARELMIKEPIEV